MFVQRILDNLLSLNLLKVCIVALAARLLYNKFGTGLNHIPGPFWASFTDFYRFFVVRGRRPELWNIRLHEKYGPFVRIGPKTVICSEYAAAKKIYALNSGFVKVGLAMIHFPSILQADISQVRLLSRATGSCQRYTPEDLIHVNGRGIPRQNPASSKQCLCDELLSTI